jgi:hypothetical protein
MGLLTELIKGQYSPRALKMGGLRQKTVRLWYPFSANHYRYFDEIYKAPVRLSIPLLYLALTPIMASSDHNLGPIYDGDSPPRYVIIN